LAKEEIGRATKCDTEKDAIQKQRQNSKSVNVANRKVIMECRPKTEQAGNSNEEKKEPKGAQIIPANAVPNPGTMMIAQSDTLPTQRTMMGTLGAPHTAFLAQAPPWKWPLLSGAIQRATRV